MAVVFNGKIMLCILDVTEWSRALDISLIDWCCSVSNVRVRIPSIETMHLSAQTSNSDVSVTQFINMCYKNLTLVKTT